MSAVTLSGGLVHYEVLGRGRPVMLLHSWVGSWRYWVPTMQQLQAKYRVYALDLYGFGDSAKNSQSYPLDSQVQLVSDFMKQMVIPKAAFIGHGLGALVAAQFAYREPDKAPRMLLVSAPLFDPGSLDKRIPAARPTMPLTDNRPRAADPPPAAGAEATIMSSSTAAADPPPAAGAEATIMSSSTATAMRAVLMESRARGVADPLPPAVNVTPAEPPRPAQRHNPLQASVADVSSETLLGKCFKRSEQEYDKLALDLPKTDPQAVRATVSTYDSGRVLDMLRLLTMPTVIVQGTEDPVVPWPGADNKVWPYITADKKDESTLVVELPGVRHFPMLEFERFSRLVNDFLEAAEISKLEIKERWKRRTR